MDSRLRLRRMPDELDEGARLLDAGVPLRFEHEVTTSRFTYLGAVLPSGGGSTRTGEKDLKNEVSRRVYAPLLMGHPALLAPNEDIRAVRAQPHRGGAFGRRRVYIQCAAPDAVHPTRGSV